ncbi:MAG TPA: adenylosuccinate lyase [Terriglobales bacterium]|nr:adenylosuccinate lyase [Terriglobales bacterium]
MIARYTRREMGRIWSEENRFQQWLAVEKAAAAVQGEMGIIPAEAAAAIVEKAACEPERIAAIEAEVKHDLIAFTTNVAEHVGEAARFFHYGLTSNDTIDTAQALQLTQTGELLRAGLARLGEVLRKRALDFAHTPQVGRTHGIHAEPVSFGLTFANWFAENARNQRRLDAAVEDLRVGKISGAVGTFAHLPPEVEVRVCARLGLKPAPISTQVLQRDRHAAFLCTLAVIGSTLDKIALEIRHLQRTEVREAEEFFSEKQKGSSAMPHKRNPVTCEQICGLARLLRSNAQAALENVALWHERDISHSSVERVILPDSCILLDYMLAKTADVVEKLLVYPEQMLRNLALTHGLVYSGQLLLDLVESGVSREQAYRWVQRHAMETWRTGKDFRALVEADPEIRAQVAPETIAAAFDIGRHLRHADAIIARALASS